MFPSKLFAILAAGRPLVFIGDPQGEISLLVEREGIGVAVRAGDAAGLADQLLRLAGDAGLREAMGARSRALLCALRQAHCVQGLAGVAGGVVTTVCWAPMGRGRDADSSNRFSQVSAERVISSSPGPRGCQPKAALILALAATSLAGSPARRLPMRTAKSTPEACLTASITSRTL